MQRPSIRRDKYLRLFWFLLTCSVIAGAVALFEARNANRDMVISERGVKLMNATITAHPDSKEVVQILMQCIRKGLMRVDKSTDEEDINRPRQDCPKYNTVLEATHASPMGMYDLGQAYTQVIVGLKAQL